ncbi:NERD domain-containing protein [Anaerobacillus alkaliphilus]|uniref:NERD domain-containing protein n=1 Tax=Anaerobacillus alkaliphilus TaxID=1548597 RepID=A0A4Q0VQZ6_9BACI|nr:nuclease-related domain-containing protein [Anaerobacillus alkaliphilus]RXI97790.1 NERD domain-containing protein [Anaerobacillus alkaliphilus]
MDVIKHRTRSDDFKILTSLYNRGDLSDNEKCNYLNAEKGLEGEQNFDHLLSHKLSEHECLILHDLLLEYKNSFFQIDTLVLTPQKMYNLDVKYSEGVYYIDDDHWYFDSGKEIKNPVHQLNRCETLFRQWLSAHNITIPVESYLIFNNPEFTLFQAPRDLPIILPTQLNMFLKKFVKTTSKITNKHREIANLIHANHSTKYPFNKLPSYTYDQLKKGVICAKCNSFQDALSSRKLVCKTCGTVEKVEVALMRSVEEYNLLFPDRKITVGAIQEWCKIIKSRKAVRVALQRNMRMVRFGKHSYYE